MTLLSICIPTYNRALFLPDLLKSIFEQKCQHVEVIICDNGSTDATESVVRQWQEKHPIVYERLAQNVGPDLCFLKSIEIASGTFCWLMGDDDILEEGGLERILAALQKGYTGITVRRMAYDLHRKKKWLEPSSLHKDQLFEEAESCLSSLFLLFGFLSAQIVKRSAWLAIAKQEDLSPYYNAYVLIYVIGRMIQENPRWLYIHTPCVGWRSGNDSFEQELGYPKRFILDLVGYTQIAKGLFPAKGAIYRKIANDVISTHLLGRVRDSKFRKKSSLWCSLPACVVVLFPFSAFWLKLLPALCLPCFFWKALRPFYRLSKRLVRSYFPLPT